MQDVLERLQVGPLMVVIGLQDPGNLGDHPAFVGSPGQRRRGAGPRHGKPVQLKGCSRVGRVGFATADCDCEGYSERIRFLRPCERKGFA